MQWKMYQHELIQSFIAGAMHIFCLLSLHQSYIASSKPWQWSCFKPVIKMCANNIMNGNMCESVHHSSAINQCIINYTHAVKYMYSIFSQFFFFYAFFFLLCVCLFVSFPGHWTVDHVDPNISFRERMVYWKLFYKNHEIIIFSGWMVKSIRHTLWNSLTVVFVMNVFGFLKKK